jgi:hypothetical protein
MPMRWPIMQDPRDRQASCLRVAVAVLIVAVLLGGAVVYRELQLLPYPMGGGRSVPSPHGALEASATTIWDESFWGTTTAWYEFQVTDGQSGCVRVSKVVPITEGTLYVNFYHDGDIIWEADSTAVSFGKGDVILWSTSVK